MCQKSRRIDTLGIKWKFNKEKTKLGIVFCLLHFEEQKGAVAGCERRGAES